MPPFPPRTCRLSDLVPRIEIPDASASQTGNHRCFYPLLRVRLFHFLGRHKLHFLIQLHAQTILRLQAGRSFRAALNAALFIWHEKEDRKPKTEDILYRKHIRQNTARDGSAPPVDGANRGKSPFQRMAVPDALLSPADRCSAPAAPWRMSRMPGCNFPAVRAVPGLSSTETHTAGCTKKPRFPDPIRERAGLYYYRRDSDVTWPAQRRPGTCPA